MKFWISYAKNQGIKLPYNWASSFKSVMKDSIGINSAMYALVDELKEQHISIALLSNIDERLSKLIREFGLYEPFNPCLLSCEIGIEKPDLKAYELLLTRLNLPAKGSFLWMTDMKMSNQQKKWDLMPFCLKLNNN